MTTLIVRRMRVLRARAQRLAAVKRRHVDDDAAPFDAEFDTDSRSGRPATESERDATSVVDLDLGEAVTSGVSSSSLDRLQHVQPHEA